MLKIQMQSEKNLLIITRRTTEPGSSLIVLEDATSCVPNTENKLSKPTQLKPGQVTILKRSNGSSFFCCPECPMAYPQIEQLEMHLMMHKIVRRFICDICGAGLKRKEHLERHKLTHKPDRPFVCGVCHRGYKRKEHLKLHALVHSDTKTELCGLCGKGFYRKDHLRRHMLSHQHKAARVPSDLNGN